jgi:hypothetical protein
MLNFQIKDTPMRMHKFPRSIAGATKRLTRAFAFMGLLFVCAPAFAQWEVTDADTHTGIDNMKKDINERLDKIYKQSNVNGKSFETTEKESFSLQNGKSGQQGGGSDGKLEKRQDEQYMEKRCRDETTNPLNATQRPICQDIVKRENKLFNYLLDMLDLAKDRQEQLKAITQERAAINSGDPNEYGQLQSNTNRLLALQAQQQIDAMNLQLTMDSYDRYLSGRRAEMADLTREAQRGPAGISLSSVLSSAASIGILKAALETSKKYSD